MALLVDLADTSEIEARVNLSRLNGRVTEHGLERSQIRTAPDQVRCKAVPEHVRGDVLLDPGRLRVPIEGVPNPVMVEATPPSIEEQEWDVTVLQRRTSVGQVVANSLDRPLANRYETILPSLALPNGDCGFGKVEVIDVQVDHFADPKARGVHQLEDRPVAEGERVVALNHRQ